MVRPKTQSKTTNLLWTGGWDSTFRLMQLVILEEKNVQPYYVVDEPRMSAGIEIYTMTELKQKIITRYPNTEKLIKPTIFINREHIKPDTEITKSWNQLKENFHLGTQYEWLPRLCKHMGEKTMEISLFSNHNGDSTLSEFRKNYTDYFLTREKNPSAIQTNKTLKNLHKLFKNLKAPLIHLSKPEMEQLTKEKEWMPILEKTRFCHNPNINIKPCGCCKPCDLAIQDQMGWRIPFRSKVSRNKLHFKIYLKEKLTSFPN